MQVQDGEDMLPLDLGEGRETKKLAEYLGVQNAGLNDLAVVALRLRFERLPVLGLLQHQVGMGDRLGWRALPEGDDLGLIMVALANAPASILQPFNYTALPWGILFGYMFFNQTIDPISVAGAAVIVAAGLVTMAREKVTCV
ncbi:hypothetical protein [Mesorhizobium sp. CN2-181]|uniref:hypothetical protein n=1 Tax=Mesorhizobium yinganensis TaxID=3157707 RepID=UPI0032B7E364